MEDKQDPPMPAPNLLQLLMTSSINCGGHKYASKIMEVTNNGYYAFLTNTAVVLIVEDMFNGCYVDIS